MNDEALFKQALGEFLQAQYGNLSSRPDFDPLECRVWSTLNWPKSGGGGCIQLHDDSWQEYLNRYAYAFAAGWGAANRTYEEED